MAECGCRQGCEPEGKATPLFHAIDALACRDPSSEAHVAQVEARVAELERHLAIRK